jgi:hypothetical protein
VYVLPGISSNGAIDIVPLQCPSCPDPQTCARLLDEKWRQAYQAVFRFGPCQPSMVFRYLRTLEGVSPPLALSHLVCQTTAKAFVATRTYLQQNSFIQLFLMGFMDSLRSYVLAWCAWKWHRHGAAWCARRGGSGNGERDAPTPSFLVLLAKAGEPCSAAWAATSSSSPSRHNGVKR